MEILDAVLGRHTTKAFDPARKIPADLIRQLRAALRHSPSSVNAQPWHFIIAASDEGKARIARAMTGNYAYNAPKVRDASHVIVLCRRTDLDGDYLTQVLDQESLDGRFADATARTRQEGTRKGYVSLHRKVEQDLPAWMEKQVYLALGFLLLTASALKIDACPMEGFERAELDQALGLEAQGLAGAVVVALGYRSGDDFNAALPKSRLAESVLFTEL